MATQIEATGLKRLEDEADSLDVGFAAAYECGCICGAVAADLDSGELIKALLEFHNDGLVIHLVSAGRIRKELTFDCPHGKHVRERQPLELGRYWPEIDDE